MDDTKHWYMSRTIWASIVTIFSAAGGLLGLPAADIDHAELTETILQLVTAISGLVAVFGRLSATRKIG